MAKDSVRDEAEKSKSDDGKGVVFQCRFCQQSRPINEMVIITRFFPPLVACRECERELR